MTTKPKATAEGGRVASRFRHAAFEGVPEIPLDDAVDEREPGGAGFAAGTAAPAELALPPVWFLCGAGGTGKTVLARWLVWRMRQHGREAVLAALDPGNRSLARWFDDVQQPASRDSAHASRWLVQDLLDPLMEMNPRNPAVLDFGGGDVALAQAVEKTNGLHTVLGSAGLGVVACYVLSPRIDDLGPLQTLERLGFQPRATLLVLNEGRADPTLPRSDAFASITAHSVFRAALARGAQPVWMPALESDVMQEIDAKRLDFSMARDGQVPDGARFPAIGGLRRSMVARWLERMEQAFMPLAERHWLP
jgi:hypothetical protein